MIFCYFSVPARDHIACAHFDVVRSLLSFAHTSYFHWQAVETQQTFTLCMCWVRGLCVSAGMHPSMPQGSPARHTHRLFVLRSTKLGGCGLVVVQARVANKLDLVLPKHMEANPTPACL